MAWLISKALMDSYESSRSSPEPEAESSAESCSDGGQSAPSKSNPTPLAYCAPDKMKDFSRLSRFGITFAPLTGDRGKGLLTWFQAGFPVKTSAQQEREQASQENVAGFGWKWRESSVKYDPVSRSWKTRQFSLLADSEWFSETWPRWGTMRDGECWELPMSERPTYERGSGLLPTPCATNADKGGRGELLGAIRGTKGYRGKMWPTSRANDAKKGSNFDASNPRNGLAGTVKMFPTVTTQDAHNNGSQSQKNRNTAPLNAEVGGKLNPMWVEWLMGFPLGWTELKPSATPKSRNAPPKLGES